MSFDPGSDKKKAFAEEANRRRDLGLKVFGKTFEAKDRIKNEFSGIWDNNLKCWLLPDEESMFALGAVKCEGEYGVYYHLREVPENGGPSKVPAPATPKAGDLCPACGGEPLDLDEESGSGLICYECGYRNQG